MSLLTFKGGVHPNDGKALAKDKAIVQVQPKGDLVYPMSQHIGAPAVPIVAKGDHVLRGQRNAEAGGFVSAPIRSEERRGGKECTGRGGTGGWPAR